ncbi:MAG: Peptidase [Candidatus Saccharibacteria bacterium]|nr:Peptidase [Candidatus Saccharibacteria bacterium]
MKKIIIYIILVILSATSTVLLPLSTISSAVETANCDEDYRKSIQAFLNENEVPPFFDPCVASCTTGQEVVSTNTTIKNTENATIIYNYLTSTPFTTNNNKPLTPAQAAGIIGNMYVESGGLNPSSIEDTRRADKGHGLVQWTFGRWTNLSNFAAQQAKPWDDINVQLAYLKTELEGSEQAVLKDAEFASATDPSVAAQRFRVVFERADPLKAHDDKRILAAAAVYAMFGGSANTCSTTASAVAGDFVQTAINFALETPATEGKTSKADARDTYQVAKEKFNPSVDWTDCGGYIATALYASGVDTNYPTVGVSTQLAYVKSNTAKYIVMTKPKLTDLQPGDILYISGHTTIYTGKEKYPMVDASLNGRVPSVRSSSALQWMLSQNEIELARIVK